MRIVVCEDDVTLRSVLSTMLEDSGDEVIAESDNAIEALELIRRFHPDIVLLDHALRSGTGLDVVEAIERDPDLSCHVVLFSAFTEASRVQQSAKVSVVSKPDFAQLKSILEKVRTAEPVVGAVDRRRPPARPIDHAPDQGDEDDPLKFFAVLGDAQTGDTILMLSTAPPAPEALAAVAEEGRRTIRAQDWLVHRPRYIATLLVGGTEESAARVVERIGRALTSSPHAGVVVRSASAVLTDDDMPSIVFERLAAEVSG